MRGALKARRERFEADRTLALMGAYFAAQLGQCDWRASRIPNNFADWHDQMTKPRRALSDGEIIARFEAMAMAGLDVIAN